eukprot:4290978-Prymnesium_polylepis.1
MLLVPSSVVPTACGANGGKCGCEGAFRTRVGRAIRTADNESNPPSPGVVNAKKRKKTGCDAPESGDKSLLSSVDDTMGTVVSDEQVRAIKWSKWNELCDLKNGEWYFPKQRRGW